MKSILYAATWPNGQIASNGTFKLIGYDRATLWKTVTRRWRPGKRPKIKKLHEHVSSLPSQPAKGATTC